MWVQYNPNPHGNRTEDCAVRAVAKATDQEWGKVYLDLAIMGYCRSEVMSANSLWGAYLHKHGFRKAVIPNSCIYCYTVNDFCRDNPKGVFVLALSSHVVTVVNGDYYDTWDSGQEIPIYYWKKEGEE